uniref:Uncharacterized protein n=1 Tax=Strongyloides papillosus TaxID=174720 RepID=A0A0N5BC74_STREA
MLIKITEGDTTIKLKNIFCIQLYVIIVKKNHLALVVLKTYITNHILFNQCILKNLVTFCGYLFYFWIENT